MDPIEALKEDLLVEIEARKGPLTSAETEHFERILRDCVRFEEGSPSAARMDRAYIVKEAGWMPRSGKSVKPGNLRFNLGKLLEASVSGVGAYIASLANPIFGVFTGIVAFRSLLSAATVELTEDDAWVLWAAWCCQQKAGPADAASIEASVHEEAKRVGHPSRMSQAEVLASLKRLEKIGGLHCIDGEWEVVETVVVKT
jgi:hypothetical protein